MKAAFARALMALAVAGLGEGRREWAAAMQAEFDAACAAGDALRFALGCLAASVREMFTHEQGHFVFTSYALILCLLIPMAAFQIGCALFGGPVLYPATEGPPVMLFGGISRATLLRSAYLSGVPSFSFLLLLLGAGNLCLGWAMLERDWNRVIRIGAAMFAAVTTLVIVMSAFFLDSSRAQLQGAVLVVELATVALVARWRAQLPSPSTAEHPG